MADFHEQRVCIKFCFKSGKTATECYEMLKTAFGEQKLNPVNGKSGVTSTKEGKTSEKQYQVNVDLFP